MNLFPLKPAKVFGSSLSGGNGLACSLLQKQGDPLHQNFTPFKANKAEFYRKRQSSFVLFLFAGMQVLDVY
jgi:hypothetical protein